MGSYEGGGENPMRWEVWAKTPSPAPAPSRQNARQLTFNRRMARWLQQPDLRELGGHHRNGPHLSKERRGRHAQADSGDGKQAQVRLGQEPPAENFTLGQVWAWPSGRGQMGGDEFPLGHRGLTPWQYSQG